MSVSMRTRVRAKMRSELALQMYPLFAEQGIETVTTEQAAKEAGISRATFFRYFSSKEEAVVTAVHAVGTDLASVMEKLEPRSGESILEMLRRCFEASVIAVETDASAVRGRTQLVLSSPSLRAAWSMQRSETEKSLAEALNEHCENLRLARTATVIALTLHEHALVRWLESEDISFRDALDESFDYAAMLDTPR